MQILHSKQQVLSAVEEAKQQQLTIGLVPTMGALHEGHGSLVSRSVSENDITIVSVFVNPTQFNNKEDLRLYPRTEEADAALLERLGVTYMFAPTPEEMYSPEEMEQTFCFDFDGLDQVMEGKMRPGHFNGVVQVVSRLLYLTRPDRAYFGEKDFQQLAILHHMVERSSLSGTFGHLQVVDCPIFRGPDGLALSSRNARLSDEERDLAVNISRVLFMSRAWAKVHTVSEVERLVTDTINSLPGLEVEYYEIVDATTLQPTTTFENAIGCVTVYCGPVRLIDNMRY